MSDDTPRLRLGQMADAQELDAMAINDALIGLDAFTDICLAGQFVTTPPSSPADGDMYLLGAVPTGAWSGQAYKLAYCIDGGWRFYAPFDGLRAFVSGTNHFLVYHGGQWLDANALLSAAEVAIASAATCDLGAAGSLFVAITGTTTITSLGTGAGLLRFVRFAGALTLTHNATSLILPGGANITTAAGDSAIFASDGSGNWRCRGYARANGVPLNVSAVTGTGAMVLSASPTLTGTMAAATASFSGSLNANAVGGNLRIRNDGTAANDGGVYSYGATASFHGQWAGTDGLVCDGTSHFCDIYTNAARGLRVGSDGSLLVGTTANGGWLGAAKAEVRSSGPGLSAYTTSTSSGHAALYVRVDSASPSLVAFYNSASNIGSITTSGSATSYNTSSDARLKAVAAEQRDYRGAIRALWVGDFTWKASGAPGFGVLAQQAYDVMPGHAGVTRPDVEEGAWQASSEPFAFLALWGTKDLYAMVEALAARVTELEARHAAG